MKKGIALILCLALFCTLLVGCNEDTIDQIKDYRKDYDYEPPVIEDVVLDMYVIADNVTEYAAQTVVRQINQYTESVFKATLNIHYVPAASYNDTVMENLDTADIVLINSKSMLDTLVMQDKLADLSSFVSTNQYGKLGVTIANALLDAARVGDNLYCIPNNHLVTPYKYVRINKSVISGTYNYSEPKLREVNTAEAVETLKEALAAKGAEAATVSDNVVLFDGRYEDKATWEAQGWIVNVLSVPAANDEEAFTSAFGIIKSDIDADRSMQLIYAFTMDEYLHNLLQYGFKGTNYTEEVDADGNVYVTRIKDGRNDYIMNPLYTGDIFGLSYCEELGITPAFKKNGALQNKDAVAAKEEDTGTAE